jgi:hypothetical protein
MKIHVLFKPKFQLQAVSQLGVPEVPLIAFDQGRLPKTFPLVIRPERVKPKVSIGPFSETKWVVV